MSANSNCFWKANGASPATCESAAGTKYASALTCGTLNAARLPGVAARKDQTGTWDLRQTFMAMPALPSTNCYVKSNGTGSATCDFASAIVSAADLGVANSAWLSGLLTSPDALGSGEWWNNGGTPTRTP